MIWLKQSTSVDVGIGPFLDETDGKTAETGLTITQPDIRLKKNGGNWAQKAAAQTLTHEEAGWYELTLDATDTDTLGRLIVAVHESGALPVWKEFMVVPANVWDSMFGADLLQVDTREVGGTSQTAGDIIGDTNDLQTKIGTPSNLGGGATLAANLSDIEAQTDDIGVAGQGLTALPWNAAWDPEVQSEVADALAVYDPPTRAEATADVNSVLAELGHATYGLAALETLVDDIEGFVDALETRIPANVPEISSPPGATPTPAQLWAAIYQVAMNEYTQTATQAKFRKNDGTVAGTASVSDDGVTATRGQFA
jgi:hypothetical protein